MLEDRVEKLNYAGGVFRNRVMNMARIFRQDTWTDEIKKIGIVLEKSCEIYDCDREIFWCEERLAALVQSNDADVERVEDAKKDIAKDIGPGFGFDK